MAGSSVTSARRSSRGLRPCASNISKLGRQKGGNAAATVSAKRVIKKWEQKQIIQFSMMLHGYKVLHGHLPVSSDKEFWAWCCARFYGRFTIHQLRDKMRRLKLRHQQLSSGRAKSIKLGEKETFDIWMNIVTLNISASSSSISAATPPHDTCNTSPLRAPPPPAGPPTSPPPAPCTSSLSSGTGLHPPMRVVAEDIEVGDLEQAAPEKYSNDPATTHTLRSSHRPHDHEGQNTAGAQRDDGHATDKPEAGDYDIGVEEVGGIGAEEQRESGSTYSLNSKMGQENKFGHGGFGTYHNVNFDNDVASDASARKTLLHHATVADLASTTKALAEATRTLAEIVQSHGPPQMI